MDINETKTLPPLVYGKLAGVLEFFVDEVKITENFNFESNVCDIIVQIQWWGETMSSYIRPLRISYFSKRNEPILDTKIRLHSLTYEIRTDLELFKSYLRSIEVMELAVFDKIENAIIGSAFVKDLISIIFNNKITTIPVINYFGNRIGELKLRLAFHLFNEDTVISKSENLQSSYFPTEDLKINLSEIHTSRRAESRERNNLNELHQSISNNIQKQLQSLDISDSECCIRSIHYNTPASCHQENKSDSKVSSPQEVEILYRENFRRSSSDLQSQTCTPPQMANRGTGKIPYSEKFTSTYSNLKKQTYSPPQLPSKEMYDDSSKVLYFNVKQNKKLAQPKKIVSRPKSAKQEDFKKDKINVLYSKIGCEKIQATKPLVIEFKSPQKVKKKEEKKITPKVKKKAEELKSIKNVSEEISKINKVVLPSSNSNTTSPGHSDLEKIPVKDVTRKLPNSKVLNYLLGKDMSKKDELSALNEFRKMSPCQNIVSTITDLCRNQVKTKCCKNGKIQVNNKLQFNLNDPIEKLYYKTFFSNNEQFEIAELLNRPENKFILDRRKGNKEIIKDSKKINTEISGSDGLNSKKSSPSKKNSPSIKNCDTDCCKKFELHEDKNLGHSCCEKKTQFDCEFVRNCHKEMNEVPRPNNCLRCKYYKKLGELDKIIESLKVFEKRMVTIEKESKTHLGDEYNLKPIQENRLLLDDSPTSTLTDIDLNGIDDDMQSISSEVEIERKNLLDDYDDDLENSLDDSDFVEFSDYLARSRIYNTG